jgi:hypothetical protein
VAISGYFSHGSFQVSLQTMGRRYSVIPFFSVRRISQRCWRSEVMVDGGEALQWTMEEAYRIIETLTGVLDGFCI